MYYQWFDFRQSRSSAAVMYYQYGPQRAGLDEAGLRRLVPSVWHGRAAESVEQNQTCNVRFSTTRLATIPFPPPLL